MKRSGLLENLAVVESRRRDIKLDKVVDKRNKTNFDVTMELKLSQIDVNVTSKCPSSRFKEDQSHLCKIE